VNVYDPAGLATNRAGFLTAQQRAGAVRAYWSGFGPVTFAGALFFAILGVQGLTHDANRAFALLALASPFGVFWAWLSRASWIDVHAGRIESVSGPFRPIARGGGKAVTRYWFISRANDDQRFTTTADIYAVAPEGTDLRLYVLPKTRRVVNFEALFDSPKELTHDIRAR